MRKNNSALVLFVFIMLVSTVLGVVFADNEEDYITYDDKITCDNTLYIVPEYTTIYENDVINVDVGCDGDCNFVQSNEEFFEIVFDNNIFELDLSEIKSVREGIEYLKYETKLNGNKINYKVYYRVTDKYKNVYKYNKDDCGNRHEDFLEDNNQIDDIILKSIKLKVKDGIALGTYIVNDLPITIIKNENNPNGIKEFKIESDFVYTSCNNKCNAIGIGGRSTYNYDGVQYTHKNVLVVYENGEVFKIPHEFDLYYIITKSNYNTVYRNDLIDIDIKYSYFLGVDVPIYIYDNEAGMYEKYENGYYKVVPLYITFKKNSFDLNIDSLLKNNDKFNLRKIYKTYNDDFVTYEILFESKYIYSDSFDSILDIKLNVKSDAPFGVNPLYIGVIKFEKLDEYIFNLSYINVIEEKNNSKTLKNIKMYSTYKKPRKLLNIDVIKDKQKYVYNSDQSFIDMNVMCNQRCYADIPDDIIVPFDYHLIDFKVRYDDGTIKEYTVEKSKDGSSDGELFDYFNLKEYDNYVVVIGNNNINVEKDLLYIKNIFDNSELKDYHFTYVYYNYDELNNIQRDNFVDSFKLEFNNSKFPYIIILRNGTLDILSEYDSKNDINNFLSLIFRDRELNYDLDFDDENNNLDNNDNVNSTISDDVNYSTISDDNIEEDGSSNLFMIIGITSLVIVIIVVFIIVHKKKKVVVDFVDNNGTDVLNENIDKIENTNGNDID